MKQTQYSRIERFLQSVGRFGASYGDLMKRCGTNWPHKRLSEMEHRGYRFKRWQTDDARPRTMIALVGVPK